MEEHTDNTSTLLIWDSDLTPAQADWTIILWRSYNDDSRNIFSIPRIVERNAELLRRHYLSWVYRIGETRIRSHRVIDHLELYPGFSYWWMTPFSEKCNYDKSPGINDSIRLFALDNWASNRIFDRVILVSASASLKKCIRSWCKTRTIDFEWKNTPDNKTRFLSIGRLYHFVPQPVKAFAWLVRYLFRRRALRGVGLKGWRNSQGRISFISYLFNLELSAARKGRFQSRYWGTLPGVLQGGGYATNWLHHYVKSVSIPTSRNAADNIRQFNGGDSGYQRHVTLDSFIDAKTVFRSLSDWARLIWQARGLQKAFLRQDENIDLWPLYKNEWFRSICGPAAISNLLHYHLFESAMSALPKQRVGVYLQENQGWETAFIQAWRKAGHGILIGMPHSTVRFWDMRYYHDPRSYARSGRNDLPLPDRVAVNGRAAKSAYLGGGYPEADLVEVEALRYLYLSEKNRDVSLNNKNNCATRILVLGDYLDRNTRRQMHLLSEAVNLLSIDIELIVKPHPNCPIRCENYPELIMELTMAPISDLLKSCDIAYTSSTTSAAVDAYCSGLPIVSALDPDTPNLSPLRGRSGVLFVNTSEELADALTSGFSGGSIEGNSCDFFTLDSNLPRWRELLM